MTLLDRHLDFVLALREAGLPVSVAEDLDAARAISAIGVGSRPLLKAAYAATLVKRELHRPAFEAIFDLYFPAVVGAASAPSSDVSELSDPDTEQPAAPPSDGPADLASFRDQLVEALAMGDEDLLAMMAREAVERFGRIQGRGEGQQRWSSYNVGNRVAPDELVDRVLAGLGAELDDSSMRRSVQRQVDTFNRLVQADVSRRAAEVRGPAHVARHTVRASVDQLDFTAARKADLEEMRRQIQPLARRLATRMSKHQAARGRGPLDFRRTVRASLSNGGVPLETHHRPRTPSRTDLVILCDVSGSVANFANFTLMLVFALREHFSRVRAFTFVDEIHEVTDRFRVGADPVEVLAELAASARYASMWGRTSYGRAFTRFAEAHRDALNPRTNLLVLGDARSNYTDLALPVVRDLAAAARHSWWLNPEHRRHWNTGDSAARDYDAIIPMVECRNLTQLGEFVERLA